MGNYCRHKVESEQSGADRSNFVEVEKQNLSRHKDNPSNLSIGSETTKSRNTDLGKRKRILKMRKPTKKIFTIRRKEFSQPIFDPVLTEKYKKIPLMGPIELEDQSTYEGQLRHKLRYGFGEWVCTDGAMFEGYWDTDKRNGVGRLFLANGHVYDGFWANDRMQGQGRLYVSDKEYYEGSFEEGMKSGLGKYILPDESYYEGTWAYDEPVGEGMFYCSKTKKKTARIWSLDCTQFL